jgi:hypothetical protein
MSRSEHSSDCGGLQTENHHEAPPVVLCGFVLLMCAIAYTILVIALKIIHDTSAVIHRAIGGDTKSKIHSSPMG